MNFDKKHNRFNTNSLKWNVKKDELAMWVADMDFQCSKAIRDALYKKIELGIFGYEIIPKDYYACVIEWLEDRHKLKVEKKDLLFCNGVIPAISSIIRRFTEVAENVIVQSPVYNVFYSCIENNGRKVVENKLIYKNHKYEIDFKDLEKALSLPQSTMLLLCNPHNPSGKIYTTKELQKISDLCKKYGVLVVSDEIHCDISQKQYTPFSSIDKDCISIISPSKAFNLAGIHSATIIAQNEILRNKIKIAINTDEIAEPNSFAITASIAAYRHSKKWLDDVNAYIKSNKELAKNFIESNTNLKVVQGDATYLMWIDCEKLCENTDIFCEYLRKKHKLYISKGSIYRGGGEKFIRINIASSKDTFLEGLKRLEKACLNFKI